ncbi:hypothetical protein [Nonomuraea sp. 10N515B]|uniref:hypothetical protein n=1 Tax=Nonomuraea sp. 10N515B TaxID=3457422 RepID=UPI003FCE9306
MGREEAIMRRARRSCRCCGTVSGFPERAAEPGFRVRFGNAEFDAAVRAARAAPGADPWPMLRKALAVWRPMGEDHIEPIALLAHPEVAALITPERGREILATRRGRPPGGQASASRPPRVPTPPCFHSSQADVDLVVFMSASSGSATLPP